jgi:tight adherence protein B
MLPMQLMLGCTGGLLGLSAAGPAGGVAGLAVGMWVPRWRRNRRVARHVALVEGQLADAMDGIAAALRAGMSPSQAIGFACEEGEAPLADRLRAVVRRESLGMPLDESLELLAREEPGDDVRLAVAVLQLQHRVGGDAPAVLDDAVRTLRQRVAAAAELRSLTAQARLSGTILGLLPIGFFLFMSVVSRSEVSSALSSPIGLASVAFGLVLDGLAFLWIRHLLRSET